MAGVTDTVAQQRRALAAAQAEALAQIRFVYGRVQAPSRAALARLERDAAQAREAGARVDAAWVQAHPTYVATVQAAQDDLVAVVPVVAVIVAALVAGGLLAGGDDTDALLDAGGLRRLGEVAVNVPTIRDRVADNGVARRSLVAPRARTVMPAGSTTIEISVAEVVAGRVPDQVQRVRDVLEEGAAQGWHPARVARELQAQAQELPASAAMRTARTEHMRAYREVAQWAQAAHPDVNGWVWVARCNSRTCAYCWAMHGTIHDADEPMAAHPNCLCMPVPLVDGADYETGTELFAALDADVQRTILGPSKHDAYRDGRIALDDLAGQVTDPVWGPVGRCRSLADAINRAS